MKARALLLRGLGKRGRGKNLPPSGIIGWLCRGVGVESWIGKGHGGIGAEIHAETRELMGMEQDHKPNENAIAICCNRLEAERFARVLLAHYPNSNPVDPDGYIALIMEAMMKFSPDLVRKCVSLSGIPSEIVRYLPTVGEVWNWLKMREGMILAAQERELRRERQLAERDTWEEPSEEVKAKAKAWLDRTDEVSQKLSAQRPQALTEEQKKAALDDAAKVGKEISGMMLRSETLDLLRQKDEERRMAESSSVGGKLPSGLDGDNADILD